VRPDKFKYQNPKLLSMTGASPKSVENVIGPSVDLGEAPVNNCMKNRVDTIVFYFTQK
jgi:hypothetical protein